MDSEGMLFLSIRLGKLQIKQEQECKLTTCILFHNIFALMPASLMKNIDETMCTYISIYDNNKQVLKPIKILQQKNSPLSLLLFKQSENIVSILECLQVDFSNIESFNLHLFGQMISPNLNGNRFTVESNQHSIKIQYLQRNQNSVFYNCHQNKNGFIGAAIRQDYKNTLIGIHQGGRLKFSYGILFTKDTINRLTILFKPQNRRHQGKILFTEHEQPKSHQQLHEDLFQDYPFYERE